MPLKALMTLSSLTTSAICMTLMMFMTLMTLTLPMTLIICMMLMMFICGVSDPGDRGTNRNHCYNIYLCCNPFPHCVQLTASSKASSFHNGVGG